MRQTRECVRFEFHWQKPSFSPVYSKGVSSFHHCKRIKRNWLRAFLLLQSEGRAAKQLSGEIHFLFVFARLLRPRDASVGHLVFHADNSHSWEKWDGRHNLCRRVCMRLRNGMVKEGRLTRFAPFIGSFRGNTEDDVRPC